jgi:AraC-like DNA-binding protein
MEIRSDDLARRRANDDPRVREHVSRYLDAEGPADDDLVGQVRHLISRTLPTGHANTGMVAAHLGLHTRTLQRWLAREGQTFEGLLDEVRRDRALRYLTQSTISFGQVAAMLGYSQQSCLTRSSTRWFGITPRDVRAGQRPGLPRGA